MPRKLILIIIAALLTVVSAGFCHAGDETLWTVVTTPDALIILDRTGSMQELPNGPTPTFYVPGTNCGSDGPFYTDNTGDMCLSATSLYAASNNCNIDGPFTVTNPASLPIGNLWVNGTSCSYNGPFSNTKGAECLNIGNYVYVGGNKCNLNNTSPYYASSGTGHTKECAITSLPTITYTESDCTNGPFYKASGSGHTTQCTSCSLCTTPLAGTAGAFTQTNCTNGPFYRTTGSGHTTSCSASTTCSAPSPVYTQTNCTNGPFYKTSGSGHTTQCVKCTTCNESSKNMIYSETDTCAGPFYRTSGTGHTTTCSKIAIAKRALFDLLDATPDDSINATDISSLGMRLGLMSYYNCSSTSSTKAYTDSSGCIKLSWDITQADNTTTTPYANLYCNAGTCASTVTSCTTSTPQKECIAGFDTTGGTPLGYSLREGKSYLDYHKTLDSSASCRQKAIIVVTDGADTYGCGGNGSTTGTSQRRSPIYYAKQLAAAGYKVYVVGFGADMPDELKNTLNWMAYYGNTRNPNATQSGITTAVTVGTDPCSNGTDPVDKTLSGYAFMASNTTELSSAIRSAIESIVAANYSFSSQASVAAARVQEENFIYEASFEPKNNAGTSKEPFWTGHLRKYSLNSSTGALITPALWDAGERLLDTAASSRNMWTYKGSALTSFDTTNITAADLAVTTDTRRNEVVGFYRGDSTYNLENWKLGDLFHTNPMAVKTPTQFFYDPRQCGATSFSAFRNTEANIRTADNGKQLMLAGANDGQLHAFHTGSGDEAWSFIPPNLLQKIPPIAHNSHVDRTTLAAHDFSIDGPIQVSDVWLSSTASSGASKNASDWKTIAVFGEGPGSGSYLWSSSSTCYSTSTSGFSATYSTTYPYYCGFYALDVTNTLAYNKPAYLWKLNPTSAQAPYLGEAWSKMQIGRIKIAGNERWVGFIGGGYNNAVCGSSDSCNAADGKGSGKGFFVVDLTDGTILWSYTRANNANMVFSAPASPLPLDLDSDGFIDTVYMGDLGGNMWRFRLCPRDANETCCPSGYSCSYSSLCGTGQWTGSLLYSTTTTERGSSNTHKQIFTKATATKDTLGNVWVYFGTGENNDPTWKPTIASPDTNDTKNRLYAIKEDLNFTATYTTSNLTNITSTTYTDSSSGHGWYINLSTSSSHAGEKMISDPTVFGGIVYFATYVPDQGTASACGLAGDAFLYGLKYLSGAGGIKVGESGGIDIVGRTKYIGQGIGSSILVSYRPGNTAVDIYATASGGAGTGALTQELGQAPKTSSMTNILYWKDRRLQ